MKKAKRILAILAVALLLGMYVTAFVAAMIDSPAAQAVFRAVLGATVLVPVLLYLMLLVMRAVRPAKSAVVDAIVFDVGRVLLDWPWEEHAASLGVSDEAVRAIKENLIKTRVWDALDTGEKPRDEVVQELAAQLPASMREEFSRFMSAFDDCIRPMWYAEDWLRALRRKGYRLYYLSNWNRESHELLRESGVMDFEKLMDGGIWSYACGSVKPDPAIYEELIRRYGLDPERTVFIDDSEKNVQGARATGMSGIVFAGYPDAEEKLKSIGVVW